MTDVIPKPLLNIQGKPFIMRQILQARDLGFSRVVVLCGYRATAIETYLSHLNIEGLEISFHTTPETFSPLERIVTARESLDSIFCLVYGDNYVSFTPSEVFEFFENPGKAVRFLGYRGQGYHSRRNVLLNDEGQFERYARTDLTQSPDSLLNLGWFQLTKDSFQRKLNLKMTLEEFLLNDQHVTPDVFITESKYYSVGDLSRLAATNRYFSQDRRCIILDRDGTINEKAPPAEYILKWENFVWRTHFKKDLEAVQSLNPEFYVLTNQPAVGRGLVPKVQVDDLHMSLSLDFLGSNLNLQGIATCYHGWNDGCNCRKPSLGLFTQLQHIHDINWSNSIYIGDDKRDREASIGLNLDFIEIDEASSSIADDLQMWKELRQSLAEENDG
jgi:D-glycero-D-manno-heptose 1,7-bisphosphate phosphatase